MSCNEWKTVKLKDICDYKTGRLNSNAADENGIYPFFTCSPEPYRINSYSFDQDAIILAGNNANGKFHINYYNGKFDAYQRTYIMKTKDEDKVDNIYLYYYLSLQLNYLREISVGSATRFLTKTILDDIDIKYPAYSQMKSIGKILRTLDDKIELNNEMNKTLEEMAQSLFKRWFVDFEFPNEDGEPYKSSGGEIVDSELGMIPKGWEVKCLGDIGNVITGKTPSAKIEGSYGDECNFITPRDITNSPIIIDTERKLSSIGINNLKKNLVSKNSIGVSCIGSNLGEVYITGENSITNQQINTVVLDKGHIHPYVYIYLKNMKDEFLNMAGGSAVPIINKTTFSGINILMPDMYILNKFVQSTTCYFERIEENLRENESLIELRDSLLPKLMSGEIDLSK